MAVKKQRRSTKRGGKSMDIHHLCAELGYSSSHKDDRSWSRLNHPIAVFRKRYTQKALRQLSFEGAHKPEVHACATAFLEEHQGLFGQSNPVGKAYWPIYANLKDRTKIVMGVARIMCEQVHNSKRNGKTTTGNLQPQVAEESIPEDEPSIVVAAPSNPIDTDPRVHEEHINRNAVQTESTTVHGLIGGQHSQMVATATECGRPTHVSSPISSIEPHLEPQYRAPVAPMFAHDCRSPAPSPPPHAARMETNLPSFVCSLTRSVPSTPGRSTTTNHIPTGRLPERDHNIPIGNNTSTASHPKPVLNIPYPKAGATPAPSAALTSLWFALPGPTGDPDTTISTLVPASTFNNSTLSEFFQLVASRSGRPVQDLAFITLKCTWGLETAITVNRYRRESDWNYMKETEILERYRMEQNHDTPGDKRFLVWVFLGNTSNVDFHKHTS